MSVAALFSAARTVLLQATNAVRRLPPLWVRYLILLDLFLAFVMPLWAWFALSRWRGRIVGPRETFRFYVQAVRFAWVHLRHASEGSGTGAFNIDWRSGPIRSSVGKERADWGQRGTCGTCQKCCTTNWLPEGERVSCPFLGASGCTIYGGVYWDYFNCGRYPVKPEGVAAYACPRFEGALLAIQSKKPAPEPVTA
jgi:hypothetical protein